VGHELDGEDVGMVASAHARVEGEGFREISWIVIPDIQIGVIGARGEESTTAGPAAFVSYVSGY
jgi:hypothetical protein